MQDLAVMPFVMLAVSLFFALCALLERFFIKKDKLQRRKEARLKRQKERREFRSKVYQSEIAIAFNIADKALRGGN